MMEVNMLWIIVHKELLNNIISMKFLIGFIACLIFIPLGAYTVTEDYQKRMDKYYAAQKEHFENLKEATVYSHLRPTVDRKPERLSIFSQGMKYLGASVRIGVGDAPSEVTTETETDNVFLSSFPSIDLVSIIALLLSLLAVLFTYDAIAGERERGTLNLMMSNSISRSTVLFGKCVGNAISLLLPLGSTFTIVFLIIQSFGVTFSPREYAAIGLIFLASLIYVLVFLTLGLLFSALARQAASALMFSLFAWILLVVVMPNAGNFIANQLKPIEPERQLIERRANIMEEFDNKIAQYEATHRPKNWQIIYRTADGGGGLLVRAMLDKLPQMFEYLLKRKPTSEEIKVIEARIRTTLKWQQQLSSYDVPLRISYTDKIDQLYQQRYRELEEQARFARNLSRLSPSTQLFDIASSLAQTDFETHIRFLSYLRRYRSEFIQYLEGKTEGFSSMRWFNDEEDAEIDISDIPNFTFPDESIQSILKRNTVDIVLLFILNVLFIMAAYVQFLRSDLK
jgi:ABC-type transport system involved in multi-copper enzyme maturation permease subunit